tara:strand:- start:283 stop:3003 length:2721 start_codon:yes stop_codon:yes gene_type:complete
MKMGISMLNREINIIDFGRDVLGYPLSIKGCCYGISNSAILDTMNRASKGKNVFLQERMSAGNTSGIGFDSDSFLFWHRFIMENNDIVQKFKVAEGVTKQDMKDAESLVAYFDEKHLWLGEPIDIRAQNFITALHAFYGTVLVFQSGTEVAELFPAEQAPFIIQDGGSTTLASSAGAGFNQVPGQKSASSMYRLLGDVDYRKDCKIITATFENMCNMMKSVAEKTKNSNSVLEDGSKISCIELSSNIHSNCIICSMDSKNNMKFAFVDHDNLTTRNCLMSRFIEDGVGFGDDQKGLLQFTEEDYNKFISLHIENQTGDTNPSLTLAVNLYSCDPGLRLDDVDLQSLSFEDVKKSIDLLRMVEHYDLDAFSALLSYSKNAGEKKKIIEFAILQAVINDDDAFLDLVLSLDNLGSTLDLNAAIGRGGFSVIELCARCCAVACAERLLRQPNIDLRNAIDISCSVSEMDIFASSKLDIDDHPRDSVLRIFEHSGRLHSKRNDYIANVNIPAVIQKRLRLLKILVSYQKKNMEAIDMASYVSILGLRDGQTVLMRYIENMPRDDSRRQKLMPITAFLAQNIGSSIYEFDYDGKNVLAYAAMSHNIGILSELLMYENKYGRLPIDPSVCDEQTLAPYIDLEPDDTLASICDKDRNSVFKYLDCYKRRVFNSAYERSLDAEKDGDIILGYRYFLTDKQMRGMVRKNLLNSRRENILMQSIDSMVLNTRSLHFTPAESTKAHLERNILSFCETPETRDKMKDMVDIDGQNALIHAVKIGYLDVIDDLCTPCSLMCKDNAGRSALRYACERGHVDIVRKLIGSIDCHFSKDIQKFKSILDFHDCPVSGFGKEIGALLKKHLDSLDATNARVYVSREDQLRRLNDSVEMPSKKDYSKTNVQKDTSSIKAPINKKK